MGFLAISYEWIHIDILAGETNTNAFSAMNGNKKIPVLQIDEDAFLWESNAILNYLAEGSSFLPNSGFERAKVLQWQFFEQYSHEPYIAVARYINKYLGLPDDKKALYESKQEGGYKALGVMDEQLAKSEFLVGGSPTIADISLYAYTHVAHEGGFDLANFKNIRKWMGQIEALPNYVEMG